MGISEQIQLVCHCDAAWECISPRQGNSPAIDDRAKLKKWMDDNHWLLLKFNKTPYRNDKNILYICPAHKKALLEMLK